MYSKVSTQWELIECSDGLNIELYKYVETLLGKGKVHPRTGHEGP